MVLALTTVDRVKAHKGVTGTTLDTVITEIIESVSQFAEEQMGRHLAVGRRTEVVELDVNRRWLWLRGFPITLLETVRYSEDPAFTGVSFLDATTYYGKAETGQLYLKPSAVPYWYSPGWVEVVYQGGMAADTTAFMAAYPAISGAAVLEVTNRLNRRLTPEGNLRSFESSVAYEKPVEALKVFLDALAAHRRVTL